MKSKHSPCQLIQNSDLFKAFCSLKRSFQTSFRVGSLNFEGLKNCMRVSLSDMRVHVVKSQS